VNAINYGPVYVCVLSDTFFMCALYEYILKIAVKHCNCVT